MRNWGKRGYVALVALSMAAIALPVEESEGSSSNTTDWGGKMAFSEVKTGGPNGKCKAFPDDSKNVEFLKCVMQKDRAKCKEAAECNSGKGVCFWATKDGSTICNACSIQRSKVKQGFTINWLRPTPGCGAEPCDEECECKRKFEAKSCCGIKAFSSDTRCCDQPSFADKEICQDKMCTLNFEDNKEKCCKESYVSPDCCEVDFKADMCCTSDAGWDSAKCCEEEAYYSTTKCCESAFQAGRCCAVADYWKKDECCKVDAYKDSAKCKEAPPKTKPKVPDPAPAKLWWLDDVPWWMPPPPEWGAAPKTMMSDFFAPQQNAQSLRGATPPKLIRGAPLMPAGVDPSEVMGMQDAVMRGGTAS